MAQRTPISAGNWKMHLSDAAADELCRVLLAGGIDRIDGVQVVVAPGFLQLGRVRGHFARADGDGVGVAGQTMHARDEGAFTGEVSPVQLAEVAGWAILGHSERRQYFCEDDGALRAKVASALAHGLRPILCVGETVEERDAGRTAAVLTRQVGLALEGIDLPDDFVIAYEPVWAIGSGRAATTEQAQEAGRADSGTRARAGRRRRGGRLPDPLRRLRQAGQRGRLRRPARHRRGARRRGRAGPRGLPRDHAGDRGGVRGRDAMPVGSPPDASPPLLAVVGPTACGKSDWALALAARVDGEVIGADSRQVYRGLDIGTAKPSLAQRAAVRHHCLDHVEPRERYHLARFLREARAALDDVWARGRVPIVAGGTGQYVWALIEGWDVPEVAPDPAFRAELEARARRDGAAALHEELRRVDAKAAEAILPGNARRTIRALEVLRRTGRPISDWWAARHPIPAVILAPDVDAAELDARIDRPRRGDVRGGTGGGDRGAAARRPAAGRARPGEHRLPAGRGASGGRERPGCRRRGHAAGHAPPSATATDLVSRRG